MIAALALCECVPIGSLTRPERNQRVAAGQFWISSLHIDGHFSVILPLPGLVIMLTKSLCDF